jgi:YD repeat-containing protein
VARYLFQLTAVTPAGAYVRLDSASGSTTPTAVSPTDSAYVFPGAILRSDATTGALPTVAAGVATLYQKTLSTTGTVTATATLSGTLVEGAGPGALPPLTFPIPVNTDPAGLASTYAGVVPAASSYTYNGDGTVATETVAGVTTTYTYNADGTVATAVRAGVTRTFTWNGDGTLGSVA